MLTKNNKMNKKVYFLAVMFSLFSHVIFAQAGMIDSTFGTDGTAIIEIKELICLDLMELADKNALVTGVVFDATPSSSYVTMVKPNGELDMTFGDNGVLSVGSSGDQYYSILPFGDNKFLVYGENILDDDYEVILSRYTNDGHLDTDFGDSGTISFVVGEELDYAFGVKALHKLAALFAT